MFLARIVHCTLAGATVFCAARARGVAEPVAILSREMSIVAKTASICNFAESQTCAQGRPALQQTRGMIQAKRIDEFVASRAPLREQFLEITQ